MDSVAQDAIAKIFEDVFAIVKKQQSDIEQLKELAAIHTDTISKMSIVIKHLSENRAG
jgi:hypothetical protein